MNDFKGDYLDCLKLLIDDDIVIIDDVGSQPHNEWREEVFFDLVDDRYNSMKPTIFTSNYTVLDFKQIYQPRVFSRLFSKENIIIEIKDGQDLRDPIQFKKIEENSNHEGVKNE
jgi:DNA replication protein DnaC